MSVFTVRCPNTDNWHSSPVEELSKLSFFTKQCRLDDSISSVISDYANAIPAGLTFKQDGQLIDPKKTFREYGMTGTKDLFIDYECPTHIVAEQFNSISVSPENVDQFRSTIPPRTSDLLEEDEGVKPDPDDSKTLNVKVRFGWLQESERTYTISETATIGDLRKLIEADTQTGANYYLKAKLNNKSYMTPVSDASFMYYLVPEKDQDSDPEPEVDI
eukprot:233185_1